MFNQDRCAATGLGAGKESLQLIGVEPQTVFARTAVQNQRFFPRLLNEDFHHRRITARTEILLACWQGSRLTVRSQQWIGGLCIRGVQEFLEFTLVKPQAVAFGTDIHLNALEIEDHQPDIAFWANRYHGLTGK